MLDEIAESSDSVDCGVGVKIERRTNGIFNTRYFVTSHEEMLDKPHPVRDGYARAAQEQDRAPDVLASHLYAQAGKMVACHVKGPKRDCSFVPSHFLVSDLP